MKSRFKKGLLIPFLLLSNICVIGTLSSCEKGEGDFNLIFERRLWEKSDANNILTPTDDNKWTYSNNGVSKVFPVNESDGTIYFSKDGDEITSEKVTINGEFKIELTWSLNGGVDTLPTNIKEGEFLFALEALNDNKEVVSKVEFEDKEKLPAVGEMAKSVFTLNSENKKVSYVRLKLYKYYFKNYRSINIGVGRVKVFTGKNEDTTLPDGVSDNYTSTVQFTENNSTVDPNVRTSEGITLQDLRDSSNDLTTNGNQKVLVVPVRFANTADNYFEKYQPGLTFDGMRSIIEATYFGKREETGWESLSSYYYQSSYGRLNITGKVTPWYNAPYTVTQFYNLAGGTSSVYNLVDDVAAWYRENFDDYMEFDQDNDGYFDCIELVYAQRNCNEDRSSAVCTRKNLYPEATDLFWAFTWKRAGSKAIKNWPKPYTFVWLSFDHILNKYNEEYMVKEGTQIKSLKGDAHTVVHETGHALGLLDYYSTGYDGSTPAGRVDMMDNNVGDHCAYSKWQFNWNAPKEQIIYDSKDANTKSYEVTLKPFESSGDFVIVPAYNAETLKEGKNPGKLDSPMAEYLTIEYYTPTGLNEQDSKSTYESLNGAQCMTEKGIKMFHVDSRLARIDFNNSTGDYSFGDYITVNADKGVLGSSGATSSIDFPHHNDGTEYNYDGNRMICAVYPNVNNELAALADANSLTKGHMTKNEDLFGSASAYNNTKDFGKTNHTDFTFNNNYKNCYDMEITEMTDDHVKLVFTWKDTAKA